MDITLELKKRIRNQHLTISGSKSETNRLLLLQALYPQLKIENTSNSDDSEVVKNALFTLNECTEINVHHAGTAMRFLTAYFATQENKQTVLTGSSRMKERPISVLVDALLQLGADISYGEKVGFPPLKIIGKKITKNKVTIDANVSSQYITALMLIGSSLPNGIEINLQGNLTSLSYINMTLSVLHLLGLKATFNDKIIKIPFEKEIKKDVFIVESDWSSASYFYSIIALSAVGTKITLGYFKQNSFQGDSVLPEIYKNFGVQTTFQNAEIILEKTSNVKTQMFNFELNNTPDIAQTLIVTCLGLGMTCDVSGLHTLKIKETDRLQALKNELEKFGAAVAITNDSIHLKNKVAFSINPVEIETYQDHRMAMAFAPLALKQPLIIKNAEVVSKSYPDFWNDLKVLGFCIS